MAVGTRENVSKSVATERHNYKAAVMAVGTAAAAVYLG